MKTPKKQNTKNTKNKTVKMKIQTIQTESTKQIHQFTEEEYNSNDGMLTPVWGPSAWHFLHTMSFNYPVHPTKQDKQHYSAFVRKLAHILPCGKCRKNLKKNFGKLPLKLHHMKNRETFSKYMYELHEIINKMLGKTSNLSYTDVRERYEHFRSRCTKSLKQIKDRTQKRKAHRGCTDPLYGEKSKCILQIVPQEQKCDTFQVDDQCMKKDVSAVFG